MFLSGNWTNDISKKKKCVYLGTYYELRFTYEYKVFLVDDFVITCVETFSQSIMLKNLNYAIFTKIYKI